MTTPKPKEKWFLRKKYREKNGDVWNKTIAEYPTRRAAYYAQERYLKLYPVEHDRRFIYVSKEVIVSNFGEGYYAP